VGSGLARAVSDNWGHLPAGPYKLLMRMALIALDKPSKKGEQPFHYYKGWTDLAEALGRKVPDQEDMSEEAARKRKTIKDEVRRYTNVLVDLGAVHRLVDNPGSGTQQAWFVTPGERTNRRP
jgi:hypothetical protein